MLKKKNIAMMTAALTVASAVTPAFAAVEEQYLNEESLIAEVERLFDVKYSNELVKGEEYALTNSVYRIEAILGGTPEAKEIETISELKALIEKSKTENKTLKIKVYDKGHRTDDKGNIVANEKNQYAKYTSAEILADAATIATITGFSVTTEAVVTTGAVAQGTTMATIKFANPSVEDLVITEDSYKLDLTKPVDAKGNIVTTSSTVVRNIVGFKTLETGVEKSNDIPTKLVDIIDFRENGVTKIQKDISAYVNEEGYTEEGAALLNMLADATTAGNAQGTTPGTVVYNGKTYDITYAHKNNTTADLTDVVAVKEGGYKLTVTLKAEVSKSVARASLAHDRNVEIVITADSEKELRNLRTAMTSGVSNFVAGGSGQYTTLAGDDRFDTAIEISKASFLDVTTTGTVDGIKTKANSVVLVGEDAIVDGLAAAPLAKQKNAPILLTKKDAVGEETLKEIKRIVKNNATIYLVGGEAVISKDVEAQLIKEMNAKIVRLAGDDRAQTSIEIAKAMVGTNTTVQTAYVVGGDGEADAMSIAAYASQQTTTDGTAIAPIIVTPANGLTLDAKYFLDKNDVTTAAVIGGESKVSTNVIKELNKIDTLVGKSIDRIAGDDRHETNAKVIAKYYGNSDTVDRVVVAKDGYVGGNGKLIDALAVAPLAGRVNAPIVLATEDLTSAQAKAIDEAVVDTRTANTKLYKAGNGISSTVMSKIVKMMGLNK